ncbi:MAG TPA: haloacid dehalogenase type II [Candidatus Saccharimonadales bacterium]|nr:haloacid dehalogenase type II [Candidatus Saccharimonadales bacterium]
MSLDPGRYRLLTFDCYGTLVDWESGILDSLRPLLEAHGAAHGDAEILAAYARHEAELERPPWRPYREVLGAIPGRMAAEWGFEAGEAEAGCLVEGFERWQPFPDTVEALRRLHGRYRLGVISNVDDDLFAGTRARLGVALDWVTTAQQARAYKPDLSFFRFALERMRVPPEAILHVAQSVYHDVGPAASLGLATVRVRRPSRGGSFGATLPADTRADAEVESLRELAGILGLD